MLSQLGPGIDLSVDVAHLRRWFAPFSEPNSAVVENAHAFAVANDCMFRFEPRSERGFFGRAYFNGA